MANVGELSARITLGGMDAVESQLRSFSNTMSSVAKKLNTTGESIKKAGDNIKGMGEDLQPISTGLIAFGTAGVVASENINNAISQFQTKLGASGSDLANYKQTLYDVGATGVGSFDEVASSIVTVAQNMKGIPQAQMKGITTDAMQLASVMGTDVGEVTKTAGQLMKQFGIDGKTALDLIAKGNQEGMNYAGDYMDTINEYSVYFKSLGFNATDMFNTLISGAQAGAFNLDKVGDSVKEFNIRAKDGSKTTSQAFQALGLDANAMSTAIANGGEGAKQAYLKTVQALSQVDDQTKRNQIGVALFGTQYEDMEKDVIAATGTMTNHMAGFGGTADDVALKNQTLSQVMQGAWNQIQVAIKPVGDILKQFIVAVLPKLIAGITWASNAFAGMSPTMQKIVIAIGGIIAVIPILLVALGSTVGMIGNIVLGAGNVVKGFGMLGSAGTKLIGAFKTVGTAFSAVTKLFMANPWMILIVAVIAIVALIIMNWDKVKAVTMAVFSAIGSFFASIWNAMKPVVMTVINFFISAWNSFKSAFMTGLTAVGNFFTAIWNALKTVFMTVWNFYVAYITTVFNIIKTIIQTAWNVIKTIFLVALGILVTLLAPLWNAFVTLWNGLVTLVTAVMNKVKQWISTALIVIIGYWNTFKAGVQAIWNWIYNNLISPIINKIKAIINTLIAKATAVMNTVKNAFMTAWNFIYNTVVAPVIAKVKAIIATIVAFIMGVLNRVKQGWINIFNAVRALVTSVINSIKSVIGTISSFVSGVVNKVKGYFSSAFNGIKSLVSSAISTVKSKISSIWSTASSIASKVKSAFSKIFSGIKTPSFSLNGWTVKQLPKLPHISVKWHAKGGILDHASLIGAGEKGAEAIVPLSSQKRMKPFANAVARFMPESARGAGNTTIHVAQLVVREEADVERIAKELNRLQDRKTRARGGMSFNG